MNDYEILIKLFKPYKITRQNKVSIINTMEGDYVLKQTDIDYEKLYQYLFSRGFTNIPSLNKDTRNNIAIFKYEKDLSIDNNQKIIDLIKTTSLLHNKTTYYKEITNSKYETIYNSLKESLENTKKLYDYYFNTQILQEYYNPSELLFLKNYSIINYHINNSLEYLEKWFKEEKNNKERVCLIHNNLRLDHFIKNKNNYLISWDKYKIDIPILDIYNLLKNTYLEVDIVDSLFIYLKEYPWNKEEKYLFLTLINQPWEINFTNNEKTNIKNIRYLLIYLKKVNEITTKMAKEV